MNSNNSSKASTSSRSLTGLTIKPSTPHKLQRRRLNPHGFVGCVESCSDITSASASAGVEKGPGTMKNYAAGSVSISFTSEEVVKEMGCDVAIQIVHVGDCMVYWSVMRILCGGLRRCGGMYVPFLHPYLFSSPSFCFSFLCLFSPFSLSSFPIFLLLPHTLFHFHFRLPSLPDSSLPLPSSPSPLPLILVSVINPSSSSTTPHSK